VFLLIIRKYTFFSAILVSEEKEHSTASGCHPSDTDMNMDSRVPALPMRCAALRCTLVVWQSALLMLHLHDVYINTSRWPVTIYTNEMDKPDYKNGDGNGWMERNSTSSRNGPLPRAGADHQLHSLSHARSHLTCPALLFWRKSSFSPRSWCCHPPHAHHTQPAGIVKWPDFIAVLLDCACIMGRYAREFVPFSAHNGVWEVYETEVHDDEGKGSQH
jgi:hypothetical protein